MPLIDRITGSRSTGAQSSDTNNEGFVGKYIKTPWNNFKTKIGEGWDWVKKNKANIMAFGGGALQAAGAVTGNPGLLIAGKGLTAGASMIKEGEAKDALEKAIEDRQSNPYGNLAYSDFPRIHYSRKPAGFKIYNTFAKQDLLYDNISNLRSGTKYVDEVEKKEAQAKQQKKYRKKNKVKK